MKEKLNEILESGLKKLDDVKDLTELEVVTKELTGKNSELTSILKNMGSLSSEERKDIGVVTNEIRKSFGEKINSVRNSIIDNTIAVNTAINPTANLTSPFL